MNIIPDRTSAKLSCANLQNGVSHIGEIVGFVSHFGVVRTTIQTITDVNK